MSQTPDDKNNSKLIMRDTGARKDMPTAWWRAHAEVRDSTVPMDGLSPSVPAHTIKAKNPIKSDKNVMSSSGVVSQNADISASEKLSDLNAENYQEKYLEEQRRNKEAQEEKDRIKREAQDVSYAVETERNLKSAVAAQKKQQLEDNGQRVHALALKEKIMFWEKEKGEGRYPDEVISASIDALERELSLIPTSLQQ